MTPRPIAIGDTFEVRHGRRVDTMRRERDGHDPNGPYVVTHLACSDDAKMQPYTFATEAEWFAQRGLVAR